MPHAVSQSPPPQWLGKQLYVNDGPLEPDCIAPLQPTTLDTPMEEMRRRYREHGYVFLKGLIPREDVLKAREEYFKLLEPSGVLKPGTTPVQGIFDSAKDKLDFPGMGAGGQDSNGRPIGPHPDVAEKFVDLALQAHYQDWYKETFCKHPALLDFVAKFTSWSENTLAVRRTLLRNNTPGNKAIGVHYDQIFLRHGEDTAVTAWVPVGDIKTTGGGLIYLERGKNVNNGYPIAWLTDSSGHTLGSEIEQDFTKKAKETGLTDEEAKFAFNRNMIHGGMLSNGPSEFGKQYGRRWLVTAYEAGDVVLHTPYMIHASTMNFDEEDVIRLGTDLRFVDSSRPWDQRWDKDFEFNDGV